MPIYDIAGLRVDIVDCKGRTLRQAVPYLSDNQTDKADITINITQKDVDAARAEHPELNSDDWEYMLTGSAFYTQLLKYNGFLLHSSCIAADGVAYAFAADSGTGKSTHTRLWMKRLGERAHILNDDKPAIRCIDGKVYACGTPWSGKHDLSSPEVLPLGGMCFLERSEYNWIKKADTGKSVFCILSQTVRNLGPNAMNRLFDLIEEVFAKVPLYELGCNISEEAAELSYNTMKREKDEL